LLEQLSLLLTAVQELARPRQNEKPV